MLSKDWLGVTRLCRALATILALTSSAVLHAAASNCPMTLSDDFGGVLDTAIWHIVEGDGCDVGLCGWGNNEQQSYAREAVAVADGHLALTASHKGGVIRSGKLVSENLFAQRFGRFEARIKLPTGRGLWPAFWMMPQSEQPWPLAGEIDIMEWTGNEPNRLIGAAHFGPLPPDNVHYSETLLLPERWDNHWHEFALEWRPDRIDWLVDGRIHATLIPEHIEGYPWVFNEQPFYLILNVAVGGTLGGDVQLDELPATMLVDWVRVYSAECLE